MTTAEDLREALAAPFDPREVDWKPQTVSGNRALAVAYVDARAVMSRLDAALGIDGWQDDYEVLDGGAVLCRLRVRVGGEWVGRSDVGAESEQKDGGDRRKAAFSDALKRAAVKFGVGRYLYSLPPQWCDYDPQKHRFIREPSLPAWALPRPKPAARRPPAEAAPAAGVPGRATGDSPGAKLLARLRAHDSKLVAEGRCGPGELLGYVRAAGTKAGLSADVGDWPGGAVKLATEAVRAFDAAHPPKGLVPDFTALREAAENAGYPDDQSLDDFVKSRTGGGTSALSVAGVRAVIAALHEETAEQQRMREEEAAAIAAEGPA